MTEVDLDHKRLVCKSSEAPLYPRQWRNSGFKVRIWPQSESVCCPVLGAQRLKKGRSPLFSDANHSAEATTAFAIRSRCRDPAQPWRSQHPSPRGRDVSRHNRRSGINSGRGLALSITPVALSDSLVLGRISVDRSSGPMSCSAGPDPHEARPQILKKLQQRARVSFCRMTTPPSASTPCTWNTDFAMSKPIVATCPMALLQLCRRPNAAGGLESRPQHQEQTRRSSRQADVLFHSRRGLDAP